MMHKFFWVPTDGMTGKTIRVSNVNFCQAQKIKTLNRREQKF